MELSDGVGLVWALKLMWELGPSTPRAHEILVWCFKATSSALHSPTAASIGPKEQVCRIYLLYYSIAKAS